jgi:GNAT superfamily N-acetyltransferase
MRPEVRPIDKGSLDAVIGALISRPAATHRRRLERQTLGGFVYLIGWVDAAPAGFVGFGTPLGRDVDDLVEFRGDPFVHDLHVEPARRRRGVARALMEEVERRARAEGHRAIGLTTGVDAYYDAARALYRSIGFLEQGGVFLGGWSEPELPGVHVVDPLMRWVKPL